jgi:outer membrane protein assembly factor BamD (BamD/ComL family)
MALMRLLKPSHLFCSPRLLGLFLFCLSLPLLAVEDENAVRLYQRGMKLIAESDLEEALDRFNTIATKYRRTNTCALALWEIYRIQEHLGDDEGAFEALNRLVTEQPGDFEKAHEAQFQLVKRLLGAGKNARRTLEVPRKSQVTPPEVLVAMLQSVIKNGPESELGIQAHYYLALAHERAGEKKEAIATHEDFAETYPKHELADDAGYQVAYIAYKDWKSMTGDSPHQRDAAAISLSWFIARFPESDKAAQARSCLAEVRAAEQRELMSLARYYESRGNGKAAATYYQQLALKFPELLQTQGELRDKIVSAIPGVSPEAVGPVRER